MKIILLSCFTIILCLPFQLQAKQDGDEINSQLSKYAYPVVFKNLPNHLKEFKSYFQAIAFVILTSALLFALKRTNDPQGYLSAFAFAGVLSVIIVKSSFFLQLVNDTVYSINRALNVDSTYAVANRLFNAALNFHGVNEEKVKDPKREAEIDIKAQGISIENLEDDLQISSFEFLKNPMSWVMKGIKSLVVLCIGAVVSATMSLCAFFVIILETLRYFLTQCGALILPVFIAGLMTQSFRSQSITFIFGLIGMLCWPLGWSLGHIGTTALYESILEIVNGCIITDSGAAHKIVEVLSEIENPWCYIGITAGWLATASIGSLLWLMVLFLSIVVWVIIVTLSAPFLMQKCISCGAQFFNGLASGAGQTVARSIGGTASYGMVRSARSMTMNANGERPQPSGLLRAGFAGARTMMNASRFQGDPSQIAPIFDTGIDELRHYRAEAAQMDVGRTAAKKSKYVTSPEDTMMRNASKKAQATVRNWPNALKSTK